MLIKSYLTDDETDRAKQYIKRLRDQLPTLQHISGDACEHCGVRQEIAMGEKVISRGYVLVDELGYESND